MRHLKVVGAKIQIYKVAEDTKINYGRPVPTKRLSTEKLLC